FGSTVEVVEAVKRMQAAGAKVIGFIDIDTTELAKLVDYEIAYPVYEQLKFFMVADRFMQNNGEFSDCDAMYAEFEAHLAQALIDV
ncbi:SIS domain-containing protein, partial [Flavonifractor plautii]|nr:SIS domain-containing protein [Flavonifractor plautii]